MKVDRFTKIRRSPQLHCAGRPPRLGRLGRPVGCQPGQLRHPHDRNALAHLPRAVAGRHAREPDHGLGWLGQFRRMFGLYAFFHAALHFLLFFGFDRAANVRDTASEIVKRPYLMVGMVGLILMVPLAATSTNGMIKRLGPARWKALHRLAYVAAAAGALHFYMLVKADITPADRVRRALWAFFSSTAWSPTTSSSAPTPISIGPLRLPLSLRVAKVLGRATEGRAGVRRDARGPNVPPRFDDRPAPAVRLPPGPVPEPDADDRRPEGASVLHDRLAAVPRRLLRADDQAGGARAVVAASARRRPRGLPARRAARRQAGSRSPGPRRRASS